MVANEILETVIDEMNFMVSESERVNSIILEAAASIRKGFIELNHANDGDEAQGNGENLFQSSDEFQQCISSLQFDDIVSQILTHQIERCSATKAFISSSMTLLEDLSGSDSDEHFLETAAEMKARLKNYRNESTGCSSVSQQNLQSGTTELF